MFKFCDYILIFVILRCDEALHEQNTRSRRSEVRLAVKTYFTFGSSRVLKTDLKN